MRGTLKKPLGATVAFLPEPVPTARCPGYRVGRALARRAAYPPPLAPTGKGCLEGG